MYFLIMYLFVNKYLVYPAVLYGLCADIASAELINVHLLFIFIVIEFINSLINVLINQLHSQAAAATDQGAPRANDIERKL